MRQQSLSDQDAGWADLGRPAGAVGVDDLVAELHRAHGLALVRLAKLLVGDQPTAEDVVQDVFLSLYRTLPRLRDREAILPYLRTSVINRSRSTLRSRRRAALREIQHQPVAGSAESAVIDQADRIAVLAAVKKLPARSREVLVLRYYLDLSDREIAAALGISAGTVRSTASRAIAMLTHDLREQL
jgi:RNA polymerase sigma-70 factor (sigma-E family)